jgi:hypothetical protein
LKLDSEFPLHSINAAARNDAAQTEPGGDEEKKFERFFRHHGDTPFLVQALGHSRQKSEGNIAFVES